MADDLIESSARGCKSGIPGIKLHTIPNEAHLLHLGLLSSHYIAGGIRLAMGTIKIRARQFTLTFRSLQLRQPNLDLLIIFRFRQSIEYVDGRFCILVISMLMDQVGLDIAKC